MSEAMEVGDGDSEPELMYIEKNGGTVALEGVHMYHVLKKYKTGASIWRCSNYRKEKCLGTITLKDGNVQKRKTHSCTPDISINARLKEIAELKDVVRKSDEPIPKLYDAKMLEAVNSGVEPFVTNLPPFANISRSMYDARNQANDVPSTTFKAVEKVVVPKKYRDFILADFYDNATGNRIIIFCSNDAKKKLKYIKEIFMDGTFFSCPPPFAQLYSIHGDLGSSVVTNDVVPLIYALMTDKTTESYKILFNLIQSQLPDFQPIKVHCDYELAPINAFSKIYPNVAIKGCYYHWARNIWKKGKFLGHITCKAEKRIIALTAALPLVFETKEGWEYIKAECGDEIEMPQFIKYVERYWLKPYFENMLSVFGEHHRTNNIVEAWHSKLNKRFNKGQITLLRLLNVLHDFQNLKKIKIGTNNNKTKRSKKYIINDDFITRVQMELVNNEITLGHALDKLR